jgi:hypothetical protein
MNFTKEMLVALALVMGISLIQSCRCTRGSEPAPDAAVTTAPPETRGIVDGGEDALQEPEWAPVLHLRYAEGLWGSKDAEEGWADVTSRETAIEKGEQWRYPYPYHLVLAPPGEYAYDCGFHEEPMDADGFIGWRLAWCEGGTLPEGRRHASRVFFSKRETVVEFLRINLQGLAVVELDRN